MASKNKDFTIPDHGYALWGWFWDVSSVRQSCEIPLNYTDITSWASCTGNLLNVDECAIMLAMDRAFMSALREEIKANQQSAQQRADLAAQIKKR